MKNLEATYESLMKVAHLNGLSDEKALDVIGHLIDTSFDVKKTEGLHRAIALSEELQARQLTSQQVAILHYFLANAWSNLRSLTKASTDQSWNWEQEEIEHEIINLRQALDEDAFRKLPKDRRCQILTNLGNLLNHVGRFVEAIEYWDRALKLIPSFAMARGNRGIGYYEYAYALYQRHDSILFIKKANFDLKTAIRSSWVYEEAREFFKERQRFVESIHLRNRAAKHVFTNIKSLGRTKDEVEYRRWCLENRLFLNHLNDIGTDLNAAQDNLVLPPIIIPIEEGFHYEGLFNQMKQEFVSARYLYYDGIHSNKVHFSDKRVLLYNTLDYPSYSLAVEKIKAAFRIAYSLFDKIAFFLNRYFSLGIKPSQVTFKTFWYESKNKEKGLRSEFLNRKNWPLRGLFWLSKDLHEDNPGFKQALEPEAQELSDIRNHIEHKYLKVHEFGRPPAYSDDLSFLSDTLAFSVDRRELELKTIRVLKMARGGMIYLSLAVHWAEREASQGKDGSKIFPRIIDTFDDNWKF